LLNKYAVNAEVATVLGSILASSDTGAEDKTVLNKVLLKNFKNPPLKKKEKEAQTSVWPRANIFPRRESNPGLLGESQLS
jgi:hypothetical protein